MTRPLPQAVAEELANSAADILNQAGAVVTGNQGEWIRAGNPESIYGRIQQETARRYCRAYADDPSKYTGRARVIAENACRPYLNDAGYGGQPKVEVPFRGGNCPGELTVTYETRNRTSTQFVCGEFGDWTPVQGVLPAATAPQGPISGVEVVREFFPPTNNQNASISFRITAANGVYFLNLGGTTGRTYWTGCGESYEYRGLTFTPVNGSIGDCPPVRPEVTDPDPPPTPDPPVKPFNPGPGINIDIGVEVVGPEIEVDFGTGPITVDPFSPRPEPDPDAGPGDGPPGDSGDPEEPEETGDDGVASGCVDEGKVLTGVKLELVKAPENPNQYAPGVYRGAAYIYMGNPDVLDQDYAGSMLRDGQFVFAEKDNLTCYEVRANVGYNWRVIPYTREVEE